MTTLQDKWGRGVTLSEDERGFVYTFRGVEIAVRERNDARALEQIGCVDVPAPAPVDPAEALAEARKSIEEARDAQMAAGVTWNAILWHADDGFRADLTDMILGYQLGLLTGTQRIRAKDNTMHDLTQTQIVQLKFSVGMYRRAVYEASWNAKDAL